MLTIILKWIKKYWWFPILVLIVLLIFLGRLNIIPFLNFGAKDELKIEDSPLVVKEIKEIGQLISAEYYGEVYADLNEAYLELFETYGDSIEIYKNMLEKMYPQLFQIKENQRKLIDLETKFSIAKEYFQKSDNEFRLMDLRYKNAEVQFKQDQHKINSEIIDIESSLNFGTENEKRLEKKIKRNNTGIQSIEKQQKQLSTRIKSLQESNRFNKERKIKELKEELTILGGRLQNYRKQKQELDSSIQVNNKLIIENANRLKVYEFKLDSLRQKFEVEERMYERNKENYNKDLKTFQKQQKEYQKDKSDLIEYKRKLIYIGRGWVQAGINLENISDSNFVEINDTGYFIVDPPAIIDTVINPIYNPDKNILGYQVYVEKGNFTDHEILAVKLKCKSKLADAAYEKGIMDKARTSTKETLENFLSLIGFKNIKVKFTDEIKQEKIEF